MASASLLPFFRLRRIIPPQTVYAVKGGDRREWRFTFHAGGGHPIPALTGLAADAIGMPPYGMGKSINFTPTLQNAVQSKKKCLKQVLLCACYETGEGISPVVFVLEQSTDGQRNLLLLVVDVDDLSLDNLADLESVLPA